MTDRLHAGTEREPLAAPAAAAKRHHRQAAVEAPLQDLAALTTRLLSEIRSEDILDSVLDGLRGLFPRGVGAVLERSVGNSLAVAASSGLDAAVAEALETACAARGLPPPGTADVAPFSPGGGARVGTLAMAAVARRALPQTCLALLLPHDEPLEAEGRATLVALASLAALALDSGAARSESARRAERLRALHEIGVAVSGVLDLDTLYEVVHRETARVLKVDAFYIALWDPARRIIHYPYSMDGGRCEIPEDSGLTDGPCSWVIRNRRPFMATPISRGVQDSGAQFGTGAPSLSALHVPMLLGDRVVGVMSTQSYEPDAYSAEDLHLFQMVAGQTAVAVENARLYRAVQALSVTDDLTGLPNRRAMVRRLNEELARAAGSDSTLTLLMLDLDHFKRVNDTLGHGAGDAVLREVAELLRGSVREEDVVGRWGGEEFLILLPRTGPDGAARVAETLRTAVAAHRFQDPRIPFPQTLTIGGISLRGPAATSHGLLEGVDALLYRAKAAGRNRAHLERWDAEG